MEGSHLGPFLACTDQRMAGAESREHSGKSYAAGSQPKKSAGTWIISKPMCLSMGEGLHRIEKERLITIVTSYGQQKEMLDTKTHSVADRIVSLSQPWIWSIVREKFKAPTVFGAKVSVSVPNRYTFIDRLSFDTCNEGKANEFIFVIEGYRRRFVRYPERVLADKI